MMIPINPKSKIPIYEQIYQYLKEEIKSGRLLVHTKLPGTRTLAADLMISRNTVESAYSQLVSEGYLESHPKSGYYVNQIGTLVHMTKQEKEDKPNKKTSDFVPDYDFSPFSVDISGFPFSTWRKLSNQCMNDMNRNIFLLGDPQGDLLLREEISNYLHEFRGVNCEAQRILIGAGADYLLQLLSKILGKECIVAMEDPVYLRAYQILKGNGYQIIPIPVDKEGIQVEQLYSVPIDFVYVTPSHQYPLGVVMPIKRRRELLLWAEEKEGRYIIEDDHDSEFRYKGKPIPSLQGIDTAERVVYLGTFSRAIAPAIRVGYMVLPKQLYNIYIKNYSYYTSTVSRIDQAILYEFIRGGYFERHVNKMRKRYKAKHDIMLRELKIFGNQVQVTGEYAGLYLVAEFFCGLTEQELIQKAAEKKIQLYGLARHYIDEEKRKSKQKRAIILLGFANLTEIQITKGIQQLFYMLVKTDRKKESIEDSKEKSAWEQS